MPREPIELTVPDAAAWRAWLLEHHLDPDGVWLTVARKGKAGPTGLTYEQALEEALCFGWIDGQMRGGEGTTYRLRFTPRRARSAWSRGNVERVERLGREGRMHPAGMAAVAQAKADGRWAIAYGGPVAPAVPPDLAAALAADPVAREAFARLDSTKRHAMVYRVLEARRPETRARRIRGYMALLAGGESPHSPR